MSIRRSIQGLNMQQESDRCEILYKWIQSRGRVKQKVSFKSARDSTGHGSHTASIAAGRYIENMNYKGLASGGARGVHQWLGLMYTKRVGIQVAMTEGISGSATNLAPRTLTATASSTDRGFSSDIMLGNGAEVTGESLSLFEMNASSRITSASQAFTGYFTSYQSR
ncbi:hypothetical protein KIW84_020910 [Lathyrus oleraceus]|uniref:Uncharacterized protein n=1 Tax=Pisum sativum TaxID=3888 RepID=A0A9D5B4Q9_PEA|nr:hypothetical protein KIW84_020910 [Pisum sativum]